MGVYQAESNCLEALVPNEGKSDLPHIEAFRVLSNAYYDWNNNGFCNEGRVTDLLENNQIREAAQSFQEALECLDFLQNAWNEYQAELKEWNEGCDSWDEWSDRGYDDCYDEPCFSFDGIEDYSLEPGTFGAQFEALADAVILWAWNKQQ
jgi:hypothetical protein